MHENSVVYIDPWKLSNADHDATVILVSHSHYDHYSTEDVAKAAGPESEVIGPRDVITDQERGRSISPGQTIDLGPVKVTAVPSYNPNKQFHPKANKWLGFVVEIGGTRIYYAGDTDLTDEMKNLENIDVALLPVGGTYTMGVEEAAAAVEHMKPKKAVPCHWGDIVGKHSDAERFADAAECDVEVLHPGEELTV
jgi:L-ascorbate metabolism protein UlaG (beta-lactamase superfamily)